MRDPAAPGRMLPVLLGGGIMLALAAVPLFSLNVPPLGDYPNHLARMHILLHIADSAALRANYVVQWQVSPYLAMDLIVPALARLVPLETAGRLFLLLAMALQLAGTVALHRALAGRWSVWPLAAGLGMFGWVVQLGFVNYLFGLGVALCGFALWVASSGWPARWRLAATVPAVLAVYLSHYFAFFAYGLCVAAWEAQAWLATRPRLPAGLVRRVVLAGMTAALPLALFVAIPDDRVRGITAYGSWREQAIGLLSPVRFPGSRFDLAIAAFAVLVVAGGVATRRLVLDRRMALVLALLGGVILVMPQLLSGVWGMQFRLPVLWAMLLVAALRPVGSARPWMLAGALALTLFAGHVGSIAASWQPRARQYAELRAALPLLPPGTRLLVYRTGGAADPAVPRGDFFSYAQMAAVAVIDRDAFLPFLHKQAMMPVQAAAGTRAISTPHGHPIRLEDVQEGADPVRGPAMLGQWDAEGRRNFWGDWPRHFDHVLELHFGASAPLPPRLVLVHRGSFFSLYRVVPP